MTTAADSDPDMPLPELTLIVAATSKMGIGLRGTLPWTGLKKEMAYFARVTKRAPSTEVGRSPSTECYDIALMVFAGHKYGDNGPQDMGQHTSTLSSSEGPAQSCHFTLS